jgi:ZIP family zinc transporter
VSFAQTALLGAVAGITIYIGLPLGRLRLLSARARVCTAMFAVGILAFIFVDVLQHANDFIDSALTAYRHGHSSFGHLAGRVLLLVGGFVFGSAGLGMLERRLRPRTVARPAPIAGGASSAAFSMRETTLMRSEADVARRQVLGTGVVIAFAIGLHNFAEGLAIGVSARAGATSLATVLIIGFALHNATEGFGIVGPLGDVMPSWRWIGLVGLISGGPTFVGSLVGFQVTSAPLEVAFYGLAAGAILYVIGEIWHGMRRHGHRELGLLLLSAGFAVGVITDLIVTYGGG